MKINKMKIALIIFLGTLLNCSPSGDPVNPTPTPTPIPVVQNQVDFWLTKADETIKLQKQNTVLAFGTTYNSYPSIEVDGTQTFQTIDGFGYTLTGGSAAVINQMATDKKQALLKELFGSATNSISISYLRLSIGASDLNESVFSYDDMPTGQTDTNLDNFNLGWDLDNLVPLLKEILAINPSIQFIATPWSPPVWMKDNTNSVGGSLQKQYYEVYAQYFVKYIQKMKEQGITINAITPQNEPLYPGNNPSMYMDAAAQADFIKNNLGPAFQNAGITTKIVVYDHNCDRPDYPISILNDSDANKYVNGSAFHLYGGDISALSTVHNAYPNKDLYFTEQYTSSDGSFNGDLQWHVKNVIIGSMRNWSKVALEWNLANDASFEPHTQGGCNTCKGAITVQSSLNFTRNVGYYIVAHASKFVPAGSIRIASNVVGNLNNVAFKRPDGKKVLIVENDGTTTTLFNIKTNGEWVTTSLDGGSVGTYIW